jgi:hypothetical protein
LAAVSFSAAKFVVPVATRSGGDLLLYTSSIADRHSALLSSLRSHSMSSTVGETSHSSPNLQLNQDYALVVLKHFLQSLFTDA